MESIIVYLDADNLAALLIPTPEALSRYTIEEIAEKDVPNGRPYKIVRKSAVPTGWSSSSAWFSTIRTLASGVGGPADVFRDNPSHPDYVSPVVVVETTDE